MIGQRLNSLRKSKKYSLQDMADRLGVAKSTYAGYESEYRQPPLETVKKAAIIFDTSTDYLLGHTDDPSPTRVEEDILDQQTQKMMNDPETSIFFKGYLDAPEEKKKQMRDFMKFILEQEKDRKPGDKQGE